MTKKKIDAVDTETGEIFNVPERIEFNNWPAVKNSLNARYFPKNHERNLLPSLTVPDQSMSLKEIIDRYQRGIPMNVAEHVPIYHGDEMELPDIRKMDLAEIQEMREQTLRDITRLRHEAQQEYQQEQSERIRTWDERKAQLEAQYHALLGEKQPEVTPEQKPEKKQKNP